MNFRLVFAALGLIVTVSSACAQDTWFYLGPRQPDPEIYKIEGYGTENAKAEARVTEKGLKDYCDNFWPDKADCVDSTREEYDKVFTASANCVTGEITTVYDDVFYFAGQRQRRGDGDSPNISLWKTSEGQVLGTGPFDDGPIPAQNWAALCGATAKPRSGLPAPTAAAEANKPAGTTANWTMGPRNKGFDGISYNHNGSSMLVDERLGEIRYDVPKKAIAGTVSKGTVLFRGTFRDTESDPAKGYVRGTVSGIAYVFKKGCPPAPYEVSGTYDSTTITMSGRAPKRDPRSCGILAMTDNSPHAVLTFEFEGDE